MDLLEVINWSLRTRNRFGIVKLFPSLYLAYLYSPCPVTQHSMFCVTFAKLLSISLRVYKFCDPDAEVGWVECDKTGEQMCRTDEL